MLLTKYLHTVGPNFAPRTDTTIAESIREEHLYFRAMYGSRQRRYTDATATFCESCPNSQH